MSGRKTIRGQSSGLFEQIDKNVLIRSTIGLKNAGGSCYMASIIQILIHSEKFLDFFNKYKTGKNPLCIFFNKFLKKIENANHNSNTYYKYKYKYNYIEIKGLSDFYHSINSKFKGTKGNNPMTFFIEFINHLDKNILSLFMGKKQIFLNGYKEQYEEDFIFYLIILDKNNKEISDVLLGDNEKVLENENDYKIKEKIKKLPEIMVINLEIDNIDYSGEDSIFIQTSNNMTIEYKLKSINSYTNVHSIA